MWIISDSIRVFLPSCLSPPLPSLACCSRAVACIVPSTGSILTQLDARHELNSRVILCGRECTHYFKSQWVSSFTFLALGEEHHSPGALSKKLAAVQLLSVCNRVALVHLLCPTNPLYREYSTNNYFDRNIFIATCLFSNINKVIFAMYH